MPTNKTLTVLAASSLLAMASLSPVYGESIPKMEQDELSNSDRPDVDPGASKGADAPIVVQERMQLNNSAQPDVLPDADGPNVPLRKSIPEMEQQDIEN